MAGFLWVGTSSSSYQSCYSDQSPKQTNNANKSSPKPIFVFFACEAHFADENNGLTTALATVVVATFTIVLAYSTRSQAHLTREVIALARDEFVSSHRPKIIIHATEVSFGTNEQGLTTIAIDLHCINIGNTEAIIDELIGEIDTYEEPLRANIILPTIEITPVKVGVGQRHLIHIESRFDDQMIHRILNPGATEIRRAILCIAAFSYRDRREIPRQTGICRQFSNDTDENRWSKYTKQGYETYEYDY
jgi:hypothetical protein